MKPNPVPARLLHPCKRQGRNAQHYFFQEKHVLLWEVKNLTSIFITRSGLVYICSRMYTLQARPCDTLLGPPCQGKCYQRFWHVMAWHPPSSLKLVRLCKHLAWQKQNATSSSNVKTAQNVHSEIGVIKNLRYPSVFRKVKKVHLMLCSKFHWWLRLSSNKACAQACLRLDEAHTRRVHRIYRIKQT